MIGAGNERVAIVSGDSGVITKTDLVRALVEEGRSRSRSIVGDTTIGLVTRQARRTRQRSGPVKHRVCLLLGAVLPLTIAALFPHPTSRLVVPESIMLGVAVLLTLLDGLAAGLVAAVFATFFLWVFDVQPPLTFGFADTADVAAILATGAITSSLVVLTAVLNRREHRATEESARLGHEIDTQHTTILTLQHALLPEDLPIVAGLTIGWQYVPGGSPSVPIGGDWLVFVPIGPAAVGIAIGDVAGHGLPAVRTMAEYRFALKVLAGEGALPCEVLRELDNVALRLGERLMSTCIYGVLDVDARTWTYGSAGHPPPLRRRDGNTDVLAAPHGPPIGFQMWRDHAPRETVVTLEDDDVIALYTDGLIERRGLCIDDGVAMLANRLALEDDNRELPRACQAIIADLAGSSPPDDIAMALIRYRANA